MAFGSGAIVFEAVTNARQPIDYWDPNNGIEDRGGEPILYGEGPSYSGNPWEVVFLAGVPVPGLCKVKAAPTIKFDKKKPTGENGLTITGQGYLPGPVEIEVMIWTAQQWTFFQEIADLIWVQPKRGGFRTAIDIRYPGTDLWKITSVVVEGVSVPEDGPVPQSKVIKIKAFEFLPPTGPATQTPKASRTKGYKEAEEFKDHPPNNAAGGPSPGVTGTSPNGQPPRNWVTP